jgi:hypothetical protein
MSQDRAIEMARQAGFTYGFGRADIEKFNRLYQLARNDECVVEARAALETVVQAQADEIERLKYQLELRRSQFESAEYAVNELKRERHWLYTQLEVATKVPLTVKQRDDLWSALPVHDTGQDYYIRGILDAEAAHNIKGTTP